MRHFTVTVPEGGVVEGQTFLAPLPSEYEAGEGYKRIQAPTGRWKDGLFDCGMYGWFHASLCCALCCTQIAMGQVMARLRLSWLGSPTPAASAGSNTIHSNFRNTFNVVLCLVCAYTVFSVSLEFAAMPPPKWDYELDGAYYVPAVVPLLRMWGSLLFTIWSIWALLKTRRSLRSTYSIPVSRQCANAEENCPGCEDFVCAACCGCCVVGQMLRHTGEYETYGGRCCSSSGHVRGTPAVV
uniref:Uncharacterized protein n=1 Tax=Odontella aurita TaxID=265563 RepID=A0A7S4N825_9STRA